MYTFGVLTISDKGYEGKRIDESGQAIKDYFFKKGFEFIKYTIVPDEFDMIKENLITMSDELNINIILTTGGTGFSKRDITPEATKAVIEREALGVAEAIRFYSISITKRAMLSRAVCGIRGNSVILNLPGSPKAVIESLEFVMDTLVHGLDILNNKDSDCARK